MNIALRTTDSGRIPVILKSFLLFMAAIVLAHAGPRPPSAPGAPDADSGRPFDFPTKWTVFLHVDSDSVDLGTIRSIPRELPGIEGPVAPVQVEVQQDRILFSEWAGGHETGACAIAWATVHSEEDVDVEFGTGADWWVEWHLNGERIFSTLPHGNQTTDYSVLAHRFPARLRKGDNLLAVRVWSGAEGWVAALGGPAEIRRQMWRLAHPHLSAEEPLDRNSFSTTFDVHNDLASEYILYEAGVDEPHGMITVEDPDRGQALKVFRHSSQIIWQVPHEGLSFYLKGNGSEDVLRISVGQHPRMHSRNIPLSDTEWQKVTLLYSEDFTPSLNPLSVGSPWLRMAVTDRGGNGEFHIDDMRLIHPAVRNRFEIRHLLRAGHVFLEGREIALPVTSFSGCPQDIDFTVLLHRSDDAVSRNIRKTVSAAEGEQTLLLELPALPRGYYSLLVEARDPSGKLFRKGAHVLVVPARDVEPWLGEHEGAGQLYSRTELADLYRGGFRYLRSGGQFDEVSSRHESPLWPYAVHLAEARLEMGFEILWTMMLTDPSDHDVEYMRRLAVEKGMPDLDLTYYDISGPVLHPENITRAMSRVAETFRGRIHDFEFLNEMDRLVWEGNVNVCWVGTPGDYVDMLRHFHAGVKQGNPSARVVSTGVTCNTHLPGRDTFVPGMLDAGGDAYFDVFGLHSYGGWERSQGVLDELRSRQIDKPYAQTERGFRGFHEDALAAAVWDLFRFKKDGALFYISFINRRRAFGVPEEHTRSSSWDQYFTRFHDGSPTKMWAALSTAAFLLDHARHIEILEHDLWEGFAFQSAEGYGLLVRRTGEPVRQTVDSEGDMRVIDLVGNETTLGPGPVDIRIDSMPRYIVSTAPLRQFAGASGVHSAVRGMVFGSRQGHPGFWVELDEALDVSAEVPLEWVRHPDRWRFSEPVVPVDRHGAGTRLFWPVESFESVSHGLFVLRIGEGDDAEDHHWQGTILKAPRVADVDLEGDVPEWDRSAFLSIDQSSQVLRGRNEWTGMVDLNSYPGTTFGKDNVHGKVAAGVQGDEVVLRIVVRDDDVMLASDEPGAERRGDSVSVVYLNREGEMESVDLYPLADGEVAVIANPVHRKNGVRARSRILSDGYRVDMAIPSEWVMIDGTPPARMNIVIHDMDSHMPMDEPYILMSLGQAAAVRINDLPYIVWGEDRPRAD